MWKDASFYSSRFISWLPPSEGVVTINFDASVTTDNTMAGIVIRNHHAVVLYVRGKRFLSSVVSMAELQAAWYRVKIAISKLQATKIWLEGDSATVVSWLKSSKCGKIEQIPRVKDLYP